MKAVLKKLKRFVLKSNEDYVTIHAAYSALFMFMSMFPLLLFLIQVLTTLNVSRDYLITQLHNIMPMYFHDMVDEIFASLTRYASSFSISVALIFAIWTASSGAYGILLGLNDVYRTYDMRHYWTKRGLAILYMMAFVVFVSLSLVLLVLGNRLADLVVAQIPSFEGFIAVIQNFKYPVMFVLYFVFFLVIYRVMPYIKTKFRDHIFGALFSSAGWIGLSFLFSVYVDNFPAQAMYGSLTAVILFLMWLWVGMLIIFLGGEVNSMILDRKYGFENTNFRVEELERIRRKEDKIRSYRKLSFADRIAFRRPSVRKAEADEMQAELKRMEAQAKAESENVPEPESDSENENEQTPEQS